MLNWNYLFAGIKQGLSNPHQLPAKDILIWRIGFSTKKKIMNKSSSLLLHLHLHLHLLHFLIMNKSSYFKKRKRKKEHQSKFSIPWKNSKFPNFSKKKKFFIKFFSRNRKLWSSSTFSSGATSSQLSTLSIHRSVEYVRN